MSLGTIQNRRNSAPLLMQEESEMQLRVRDFNWSQTSLGHYEQWPQCLKSTLDIILSAKQPMWLGWGPELIYIYNDACKQVLGADKHPWALGQPARLVWEEMWHICGPLADKVAIGESVYLANVYMPLRRTDYLEECYYSFSFTPIRDELCDVVGLFCASSLTTSNILNERRLKTHRDLSTRSLLEKSIDSTCDTAIEILSQNREDIPFALLYLIDNQKPVARLKNSFGIEGEIPHINPPLFNLNINDNNNENNSHIDENNNNNNNNNNDNNDNNNGNTGHNFIWPIEEVLKSGKSKYISVGGLKELPLGMANQRVTVAIIQPICMPNSKDPIGVLITGISPCLTLNSDFISFFELVARQISTAIYNAKSFEEEQRRMELLAEIDRAKTVFFSTVTHELSTPVTLILSPVEELLRDPKNTLDQDQKNQLQIVSRNAHRLLKLINSLLDISRIEAKKMRGEYEATDLPSFTIHLANVFRSTLEKAKLEYIVDIHLFGDDENVFVDRDMWEKIVFNLLSNACKYTLEGSVLISLRKNGNNVELEVKDTGVGIPESEIPFLFERFHRVEGAIKQGRSIEGAGIGLALSNELVKLHGGHILVQSTLGKGSAITVTIPLGFDHLPPDQIIEKRGTISEEKLAESPYVIEASSWVDNDYDSTSISNSPPEVTKPSSNVVSLQSRILLADDNADMRQYIKGLLEREHFCKEVIAVGNGGDALRIAKTKLLDLVITDLMMPKLDGFDLIKSLKENGPTQSIPVIILSAATKEDDRIKGLQAGADDYIVKPFSAKELVTRIESHLKITQQRKEALLRERELKVAAFAARKNLHDVMKNINIGFLVLNRDWNIVYLNQAMEGIYQSRKKDLLGNNYFEYYPDVIGTNLEKDMKRVMNLKVIVVDEYYCILNLQWYENRISPHADGICIFCTNITLRKQLEFDKQQAIELANQHQQKRMFEAEDYKRKQGEFIDTLCHELRNPLNGIYGGLSLIQSDVDSIDELMIDQQSKLKEKVQMTLRTMSKTIFSMDVCAKQQKVIVDDVLDLSKLENNKLELNPVPFKLSTLISSVIQMFRTQILEKKLKIIKKIEEKYVIADPNRLTQILSNLISNAVKFTHAGGITVEAVVETLSESENRLRVVVTDTGIGMNVDEQQIIFNRFAQANRRTSTEFGGSGLGLVISKTLVEAMGGSLSVTSEIGKGSVFTFTLSCGLNGDQKRISPVNSERIVMTSDTANVDIPLERNPANINVLIVEDNRFNCKIIGRLLDQKGYINHSVASNGKEALELLNGKRFDIIFMDVEMPVLNGIEATKLIREKERMMNVANPVPIIGISGNVSQKQIQCGLDSGMNGYLKKPYERKQIYHILDQYS